LTMATLPMTSLPNIRFAKRDVSGVVFEGPNSGYMGSLARLFDSVQILGKFDAIAKSNLCAKKPRRPNCPPSRRPRPQALVIHPRRP
jgi:hypothetical protein